MMTLSSLAAILQVNSHWFNTKSASTTLSFILHEGKNKRLVIKKIMETIS